MTFLVLMVFYYILIAEPIRSNGPEILAKSKLYYRVTVCYRMLHEVFRKNIW